jgi:subtilase family serine protease
VGPDLVIASLTAPATAGPGGVISVSDTVRNQGGGAAGASSTRFYLSQNTLLDSGDVQLGSGRAVPAVGAGVTNTGTTAVVIPATTGVGIFYLIAQADGEGGVVETQEANNTSLRLIQIGGDLAISALSVPPTGGAGAPIVVTDTTLNRGDGPVGASTTRFYLSVNALLDSGDVLLPGGRSVPPLAAGAASSGSTGLTLPAGLATGLYFLFAMADADLVVAETQEANNTSLRGIQVGSDLTVSALTVPPRGGTVAPIIVTETTTNQGAGGAGQSTTRFYLSANYLLDAGDVLLTGGRSVPSLSAGASSSGQTSLAIPAGTPAGVYYLIALADADGAVAETQEGNNATARSIAIGPDLTASVTSLLFTIAAGSTVTLTDLASNQGLDAAMPSTTRFYLSANYALDAADAVLGSRAVPAIAAGMTSTGATLVTIPAGTTPGTYFVIARADDGGVVAESYETNNLALRVVQIVP